MDRSVEMALSDLAEALYELIDIEMKHDLNDGDWMKLDDLKHSIAYIKNK